MICPHGLLWRRRSPCSFITWRPRGRRSMTRIPVELIPPIAHHLTLCLILYLRLCTGMTCRCTCIRYLLRSYTDRIYYCEPLSLLFETRAALRHTHRPRHRLYITSNISIHTHRPDRDLSRARPVRVTESPWTDKLYCSNLLSLS